MILFSSCQEVRNRISMLLGNETELKNDTVVLRVDTVEVVDSLKNLPVALSKDSVCLKFVFSDVKGVAIHPGYPITLCLGSDYCVIPTKEKGSIDTIVSICNLSLPVGVDTFYYSLSDYAGDTLYEEISLSVKEFKGRIMEEDGTPLKHMPVHVHSRYKKKSKKIKEEYGDDMLVYTDSLGYYYGYTDPNIYELVLRTCGFLVGKISRYELMTYPTQNFLYKPFFINNLCGDTIPSFVYTVDIPDMDVSVSTDNWSNFFSYDEMLESSQSAKITATYRRARFTKKITKRDALFRNPSFTICVHD